MLIKPTLRKPTFKQILAENRSLWVEPRMRPAVSKGFQKVLDCRTPALGFEVYESDNGQRILGPHTCKSRACSSCGWRSTLAWQRDVSAVLPDIPYADIGFTMHADFWPIFRQNRHLLDDLPALGAGVLQDWAEKSYGARVMVVVVRQTFGADLKFNPHLHMLVSIIGLHKSGRDLVSNIRFLRDAVMRAWRHILLEYLTIALEAGQISYHLPRPELMELFQEHHDRLWYGWVNYDRSREDILRYISRYLCRPPLAEYRLLPRESHYVRFLTRDKKLGSIVTTCTTREFIVLLADQVPDHYRHGVRYFGLLSPQSIGKDYEVFLSLLGQKRPPRPKRILWADLIWQTFGWDPRLDSDGKRMRWVGRVAPVKREAI